jgi:hypothetical protein
MASREQLTGGESEFFGGVGGCLSQRTKAKDAKLYRVIHARNAHLHNCAPRPTAIAFGTVVGVEVDKHAVACFRHEGAIKRLIAHGTA